MYLSKPKGPAGPPGKDFIPGTWTINVDETNPLYIYRGEADIGSATSSGLWRMRRFTISNNIVEWANGVNTFTNIWDNRTTLIYLQ